MELLKIIPLMEKVRFSPKYGSKPAMEVDPRDYLVEFKKAMDELGNKGYFYCGTVYDETHLQEGREDLTSFMFQKTDKKYSFELQPDIIYTWYKEHKKNEVFTEESFKARIEKEYPNICGTTLLPNISSQIFFVLAKVIENDTTGKVETENVGSTKGTDSKPVGEFDGQRPPKKSSSHR